MKPNTMRSGSAPVQQRSNSRSVRSTQYARFTVPRPNARRGLITNNETCRQSRVGRADHACSPARPGNHIPDRDRLSRHAPPATSTRHVPCFPLT
eukprot:scaffold681_cov153-Isochrysis_galbana.AAC.2